MEGPSRRSTWQIPPPAACRAWALPRAARGSADGRRQRPFAVPARRRALVNQRSRAPSRALRRGPAGRPWPLCTCLHPRRRASPPPPLLSAQADGSLVKWAVINSVISFHQPDPDKCPKSNTKKRRLAGETSVKAILTLRSN